jgi:hypothetical protein
MRQPGCRILLCNITAGAAASLAFLRFPLGQIAALGLIGYALNFRWVGFGSRIHIPSISSQEASPLLPPSVEDGERKEVSVLSHNVWCHYLQQWYAPSSTKRLAGLLASIEISNYDLVLIQELFIFRLGPFAVSDNFDQVLSLFSPVNVHLISLSNHFAITRADPAFNHRRSSLDP